MEVKTQKVQVTYGEIFYYAFFSLLLFAKGIGLYDGQILFKIVLLIGGFCFLAKLLITEYTHKEIVMIISLLLLGAIIYEKSGEKGALLYIMMIVGMKNVPIKRIFKIGLVTWFFSFGSLFVLTATHIIDSPFRVHDKFGLGLIIRWGLGYVHPNVLHISYFVLVMLSVYLVGNRFNWKWFCLFMISNLYVFLYSLSSTGVIAVGIYLVISLYWCYVKRIGRVAEILLCAVPLLCAAFSLIAPLALEGKAFDFLNGLLNTRLALSKIFLMQQPPTVFGVRIADIVTSELTMDNSFVFAFVTYGILFFSIIMVGYTLVISKYIKENKRVELGIIVACLVAGLTEPFLFNTSFKNISLLFAGEILFMNEGREKNISIIKKRNKSFYIDVPKWEELQYEIMADIRIYKKRVVSIILITSAIILCIFVNVISAPDRLIVPKQVCDYTTIESIYLKDADVESEVVLGYIDSKTEMIPIEGNIVRLEQLRNIITGTFLSELLLFILIMLIILKKRGKLVPNEKG